MSIAKIAMEIYEKEMKSQLEAEHPGEFVAIEPVSQSYFLGKTFLAVAMAAKEAFPTNKSFVLHIGHEAAFHIGANRS